MLQCYSEQYSKIIEILWKINKSKQTLDKGYTNRSTRQVHELKNQHIAHIAKNKENKL